MLLGEAAAVSPPASPWVAVLLVALPLLLGSGGIVAWLKVRADKKQGVQSHELALDESVDRRWREIIETQTSALVTPLREELAAVKAEFREAKAEMRAREERLEQELMASRGKYWRAINYIRTMQAWISRHIPAGTEPPPVLPADILDDI